MDAALAQSSASRGAGLLLAHCAALESGELRRPAHERLREVLGADLTNLLVRALAPGRGASYYRDVA